MCFKASQSLLPVIMFPMIQAVFHYLKGAAVGGEIEFEFENDRVSLDIPLTGIVKTGWTIQVVTPLVVREVIFLQCLKPFKTYI